MKLPSDKKIVGSKWVFKKKECISEVERYKLWLVAKGYSQVQDIDFNDVLLPIVKYSFIRVLLTLVVMYDLELKYFNVKTTFSMAKLKRKFI